MKRFLLYIGIVFGLPIAAVAMLTLGAIVLANNPAERQQYLYTVGNFSGVLTVFMFFGAIIYVAYRLTISTYEKNEDKHDSNDHDKDGPIDQHLR